MPRVLLVDDDQTVSDVVCRYLRREGMSVDAVTDGAVALQKALDEPPDLVVLDLMLPGLSGLEVCRRLRRESQIPILMLTALGEEHDRVVGLEIGADDYVAKPFSPRELTLRVLSILRRTATDGAVAPATLLRDNDLTIDTAARVAQRGDQQLTLTGREFDLLAFLLAHPGRAFSRVDLLRQVWGWSFGDQSTVTVHVRRLRAKVEDDPASPVRITTVWGVGYRFDPAGDPP